MSDISPIGQSGPPLPTTGARRSADLGPTGGTPRDGDRVEVSQIAQLLAKLAALPDVREDLVARVRAENEAEPEGNDQKQDAALHAQIAEQLQE